MRKSFKFLRDNPIYSLDEEDVVKTLLIRLIITGEYETTNPRTTQSAGRDRKKKWRAHVNKKKKP